MKVVAVGKLPHRRVNVLPTYGPSRPNHRVLRLLSAKSSSRRDVSSAVVDWLRANLRGDDRGGDAWRRYRPLSRRAGIAVLVGRAGCGGPTTGQPAVVGIITRGSDGSLVPASFVALQVNENSVPTSASEGMKAAVPAPGLMPTRGPAG